MLRLARVAAVHPEDNSVDIVMIDDGSRYVAAQVLSPVAGSDFGVSNLPAPSATGDQWSLSASRERDILAVTAMMDVQPVVLGFLFPQVNGVLFGDRDRMVSRHASDVYHTIDRDGNIEVAHPSGTYVRIATTPAHDDLTGKDFDGRWKITKNTSKPVHLQVVVANAGVQKALVHIDPTGNATVELAGNLDVSVLGNASVSVDGSATVEVAGTTSVTSGGAATLAAPSVTIDSPTTSLTGALTVAGKITGAGGLQISGTASAGLAALVLGKIGSDDDVLAAGVSLKTHRHGGVSGGGSQTSPPV